MQMPLVAGSVNHGRPPKRQGEPTSLGWTPARPWPIQTASRRAAALAGLTGRPSTWSTSTPRHTEWLDTRRVPLTYQEWPVRRHDTRIRYWPAAATSSARTRRSSRGEVEVAGGPAAGPVGEAQPLGGPGHRPPVRGGRRLGELGELGEAAGHHPADAAGMRGGQPDQRRDQHQDRDPAQLRPAPTRRRGVAPARPGDRTPAGRHRPHWTHLVASPRRPARPPRRPGPWAARWWRACSAHTSRAVARQQLRQRHRRQRAWCGSRPRPRSSTRYGPWLLAAAPTRPPSAVAARRPPARVRRLMLHHHRPDPGRPGRGGGAGGPGRPPAAARPRPGPGGGGCGTRGRRPGYRAGSRGTAAGCAGADRTQRPT